MKKHWAAVLTTAVVLSRLVAPGVAMASTTEAVADTGGMTLTLGVLGAPLNVAVTLDEIGQITEVTVDDPAFSEARSDDHKVRFTNEDGTTRIEVTAKHDKLKAEVKAADLTAIAGSHTWAGKLFGSDTDSVVTFDVLADAAGNPQIANVAVAVLSPTDATYVVGDVKTEVDDDETESSVTVEFMWNGYTMTLKVKAEMETGEHDDDGDDAAVKLKIELKGKDEQKLHEELLADLAGSYNWDGRFCDGTPIGLTYTVSATGDVTVDSVTVDGAASDAFELETEDHGFEVKFNDSDADVSVELKQKDDGVWELKIKSDTTEKCDNGDDDESDDDDHGDHDDDHGDDDHGDGSHGGNDDDDHGGGSGHGDDDNNDD